MGHRCKIGSGKFLPYKALKRAIKDNALTMGTAADKGYSVDSDFFHLLEKVVAEVNECGTFVQIPNPNLLRTDAMNEPGKSLVELRVGA
jgi:hypothetical protein